MAKQAQPHLTVGDDGAPARAVPGAPVSERSMPPPLTLKLKSGACVQAAPSGQQLHSTASALAHPSFAFSL